MVGGGSSENTLNEVPAKIKEYNAKQRLKKAGQVIIAVQRLRKYFGAKGI
jgi:hypothetical protein